MKRFGYPSLFLAVVVGFWWVLTRNSDADALFPAPLRVLESTKDLFQNQNLVGATIASLRRAVEGFLFALVLSVPFGIVLGRKKALDQMLGPIVSGFQSLPSVCWMPIALLLFGIKSDTAILFVVVMGSAVSMIIAIRDGVRNLPPNYVNAARVLGSTRVSIYLDVLFPATQATIVIAMKLGWAYAWRALMSGELLTSTLGLGKALTLGRELGDMGQVLAVMLVIMLLGLAADSWVFAPMEKHVRKRWGFDR